MTNIASVLDLPATEIEAPRQIPVGSYRCIVQGLPNFGLSSVKKTDFVEYTLVLQEAMEDVDEEALEHALTKPSGEKLPLQSKNIRVTFYVTENSAYRLKDFIKQCGVNPDKFKSLRDAAQQVTNAEIGIFVRHRSSQDGDAVFAEVGRTFAIE